MEHSRFAAVHQRMPPKPNLMLNFTGCTSRSRPGLVIEGCFVQPTYYMSQERHRAAYMQLEESAGKFHCLALQSQF